jgi:RHS repeat-associated protein
MKKNLLLFILLFASIGSIAEAGRMYDPEIARFSTPDPALNEKSPKELLELQEGILYSQSSYSYSYNNPVRFVDPDGKTPWDIADIGFALWSVADFVKNPSWSGLGWATVDVVGAALPVVPTSGYFRRGAQAAEAGMDAARGVDKAVDATRQVDKVWGSLQDGQKMNTDDALKSATDYLGEGYREVKPGIFRSEDGARQVRMTNHDLNDRRGAHLNFEKGKTVVDNKGRETFQRASDGNKHIYIVE